jgi:hypothetical protein
MTSARQRFLSIVFGSVMLACLLGISVDMVTANMAVEYFTVHHPKVVSSESPLVMAILWGIGASWWFGAIAGCIVATINWRRQEPLEPSRILKWTAIACLLIWIVMISIVSGVMAISSAIPMEQRRATFESDRRLVAVALAHQYEYVFGGVALLVIAIMTWKSKSRPELSTHKSLQFKDLTDTSQ